MLPLSISLKESLAEAASRYSEALDESTLEYLEKRGIDPELAKNFQLGLVADPIPGHERYRGRLAIPFLGRDDQVYGMRFRTIQVDDGPKYLGIQGVPTRLYNLRHIHVPEVPFMCITEGEIDSISLVAAGFHSVGVCGADSWKRHHPRLFAGFERVYVFGDGDEAGRKFSRQVVGSIPSGVEIVLPEGQDVNSILVAGGPEAVKELVGAGA